MHRSSLIDTTHVPSVNIVIETVIAVSFALCAMAAYCLRF